MLVIYAPKYGRICRVSGHAWNGRAAADLERLNGTAIALVCAGNMAIFAGCRWCWNCNIIATRLRQKPRIFPGVKLRGNCVRITRKLREKTPLFPGRVWRCICDYIAIINRAFAAWILTGKNNRTSLPESATKNAYNISTDTPPDPTADTMQKRLPYKHQPPGRISHNIATVEAVTPRRVFQLYGVTTARAGFRLFKPYLFKLTDTAGALLVLRCGKRRRAGVCRQPLHQPTAGNLWNRKNCLPL